MEVETHLDTVDHDLVLRNAIAVCPSLLPSFNRLGDAYQERVRAVTSRWTTTDRLPEFLLDSVRGRSV